MSSYIHMFGQLVSDRPAKPGVWKRKEGGYFVRARVKVRGKLKEMRKVLADCASAAVAYDWLQERVREARNLRETPKPQRQRFDDFAEVLLERKIATGELRSTATIKNWRSTLSRHLLPAFGDCYLDQIRRADVLAWRDELARRVVTSALSPRTAETHLKTLKVVLRAWVDGCDAQHDPTARVRAFDTSMHRTYTRQEPNALAPEEVAHFLAVMRRMFPQHLAMAALGFATGWRTCSLRPLRRKGADSDVLWDEGVVLNRRSHTVGQRVMERTKTGHDGEVGLSPEVLAILHWHIERLPLGPMRDSDLLFPSITGGLQNRSSFAKAVYKVAQSAGLSKRFTPHGMRRSNKDLLRMTGTSQTVAMAISGHLTESMHHHYSTVSLSEQRECIGRVAALAGLSDLLGSGVESGVGAQRDHQHQPGSRRQHRPSEQPVSIS